MLRDQKCNKNEECLGRLFSRLHTASERTSELEDISIETPKIEKQREKRLKEETEQNIPELGDNHKICNTDIMGILEGEEREKGTKGIFEKMIEDVPKLMQNIKSEIQEA